MDLLLELLLDLLLHVFYHVPIRGRFAPPYNYVINTCSSRSSSSSSSRSMDPWIHIFYFEPYFSLWNDEYKQQICNQSKMRLLNLEPRYLANIKLTSGRFVGLSGVCIYTKKNSLNFLEISDQFFQCHRISLNFFEFLSISLKFFNFLEISVYFFKFL